MGPAARHGDIIPSVNYTYTCENPSTAPKDIKSIHVKSRQINTYTSSGMNLTTDYFMDDHCTFVGGTNNYRPCMNAPNVQRTILACI